MDDAFSEQLPKLSSLLDFSWIPKDTYCSFSLDPVKYHQLDELCQTLSQELELKLAGWERMSLSCVLQVTVLLQRSIEGREKGHVTTSDSFESKSALVQKCSDYVCSHLGEDLSLKTVAKTFSVSEEYLTRSFKKEMGISFYQYVLLQRVAEGKRMLREAPDVSIADIAYSLGFPSPSHFSRTIKTFTEDTP